MVHLGDVRTKEFYNREGWKKGSEDLVDVELFGDKEVGPIRQMLRKLRFSRVLDIFDAASPTDTVLECGCGGSPATFLFDKFLSYTGSDFSELGIEVARKKVKAADVEQHFEVADACALPFADSRFDGVYSAHMIYHLSDPKAQAAALGEMVRVLKPGGALVMVTANPRPLLFPLRFLLRMLADSPLSNILNRVRPVPVLPYKPMTISWYQSQLRAHGTVDISVFEMPSTYINQKVSEFSFLGRGYWKMLAFLEANFPKVAARLGNYIVVALVKH